MSVPLQATPIRVEVLQLERLLPPFLLEAGKTQYSPASLRIATERQENAS
jgi:hypothetical protein